MNKKEFLIISVVIFLTIIAWIMIDVYQIKVSKLDTNSIKKVTLTNYEINQKIINIISNKNP